MTREFSDLALLVSHLRLAAEAVHVQTIELVAVGHSVDLLPVAERLQRLMVSEESSESAEVPGARSLLVRPLHMRPAASANGHSGPSGIVLVTPSTVKKSELVAVTELIGITGWPLLGVITYRSAPFWRRGFLGRRGSPVAEPARAIPLTDPTDVREEVVALAGTRDRAYRSQA
jgi:hypothetical protein